MVKAVAGIGMARATALALFVDKSRLLEGSHLFAIITY